MRAESGASRRSKLASLEKTLKTYGTNWWEPTTKPALKFKSLNLF